MVLVVDRFRRSAGRVLLVALVLALGCGLGVAAASDSVVAASVGSSGRSSAPVADRHGSHATANCDAVLVASNHCRASKTSPLGFDGAVLAALGAVSCLVLWSRRRAGRIPSFRSCTFTVQQRGPPLLQRAW
jgi:hypothetical protein